MLTETTAPASSLDLVTTKDPAARRRALGCTFVLRRSPCEPASEEGRESMAKQVNPEMAYDILEHRHDLENSHVDGLNPTDSADPKLTVRDFEFTQAGISRRFQDGRPLETMISDLDMGTLDPCRLKLEVVEWRGRFYNNDNRRLYCLKEHQRHVDVRRLSREGR
eukprot:s611_g12.t1